MNSPFNNFDVLRLMTETQHDLLTEQLGVYADQVRAAIDLMREYGLPVDVVMERVVNPYHDKTMDIARRMEALIELTTPEAL